MSHKAKPLQGSRGRGRESFSHLSQPSLAQCLQEQRSPPTIITLEKPDVCFPFTNNLQSILGWNPGSSEVNGSFANDFSWSQVFIPDNFKATPRLKDKTTASWEWAQARVSWGGQTGLYQPHSSEKLSVLQTGCLHSPGAIPLLTIKG